MCWSGKMETLGWPCPSRCFSHESFPSSPQEVSSSVMGWRRGMRAVMAHSRSPVKREARGDSTRRQSEGVREQAAQASHHSTSAGDGNSNSCVKEDTVTNRRVARNSTAPRKGLPARTAAVTRNTSQPAALPKPNAAVSCIVRELKGASSFSRMKN